MKEKPSPFYLSIPWWLCKFIDCLNVSYFYLCDYKVQIQKIYFKLVLHMNALNLILWSFPLLGSTLLITWRYVNDFLYYIVFGKSSFKTLFFLMLPELPTWLSQEKNLGSISEVVNIGGSLIQKINKSNVTLLTSFITDPNLLGVKDPNYNGLASLSKKKKWVGQIFYFFEQAGQKYYCVKSFIYCV